jgi:nitrite reductase/ring-hydroxylating ferredoxin subunit
LALTVSCSSPVDPSSTQQPAALTPDTGAQVESLPQLEMFQVAGPFTRTSPADIWAEPDITGGTVSLPLPDTELGEYYHFEVPATTGTMEFIAYNAGGQLCIRASLCPSCGGTHVDYGDNGLVCPVCDARFDLQTGMVMVGNRGYPAGAIPVTSRGSYVTSPLHSLTVAYERTASGEATLYKAPAEPDRFGCAGCS